MNLSSQYYWNALPCRIVLICFVLSTAWVHAENETQSVKALNRESVAKTSGLLAFWAFPHDKEAWTSVYDPDAVDRTFPVFLRRIGDDKRYLPGQWPYDDQASRLTFDPSGPFGSAMKTNLGYVYAEVPRSAFEGTPLDITGRKPFTMIAWIRFEGKRHLIAGIWDEGGWNKYGGRRQFALFGGLFGSQGVIAHISATGASSFPQSTVPGSQFARSRAIDGGDFSNGQWIAAAMTFDPEKNELIAYCNGKATPTKILDPVAKDALGELADPTSNPFVFSWPIYSSRSFILKFSGYDRSKTDVKEHYLETNLTERKIKYGQIRSKSTDKTDEDPKLVVRFDILRQGKSLLSNPIEMPAEPGREATLPDGIKYSDGDEIVTTLHLASDKKSLYGNLVKYRLREGAPLTIGRALGLGEEPITDGSCMSIDGLAVFNRVLSSEELQHLSFVRDFPENIERRSTKPQRSVR